LYEQTTKHPLFSSAPSAAFASQYTSVPLSHHVNPLAGLKVLDISRVIAAPVAGKILAAHGADVLWVTSPKLPERPEFDRDTARGKRSIHLDLDRAEDMQTLQGLLRDVDVITQSYRPGALAAKGLGLEEVIRTSR
jgi:crotonobetainyl-CoA:carnitine CoA-transferase CaiB-like acyl-CoA transferase